MTHQLPFIAMHQIESKKCDEAMNNMHKDKVSCLKEARHKQVMSDDKCHAQEIELNNTSNAPQIKLIEEEQCRAIA